MLREAVLDSLTHYQGAVYRGHDPRWSFSPESGDGAKRNGGRFNPIGTPALYTALSQNGAWVEAQQGFKFKAQPLTICQYEVDCERVLDLTDEMVLLSCGIKPSSLSCAWMAQIDKKETPDSWVLSSELIALNVSGIIVPSFASSATAEMKNMVFWNWNTRPPNMVKVIDDFDRLPKEPY